MRQFARTFFGKTILVILCVLSMSVSFLSAFVIGFCANENAYDGTEEDWLLEYLESDTYQTAWFFYSLINDSNDTAERTDADTDEPIIVDSRVIHIDLPFCVKTLDEKILVISEDYRLAASQANMAAYTMYFRHVTAEEGEEGTNYLVSSSQMGPECYAITYYIDPTVEWYDQPFPIIVMHVLYALRYQAFAIGAVALFITVFLMAALMRVAGMRKGEEKPVREKLSFIPFDLMLLGGAAFISLVASELLCEWSFRMYTLMYVQPFEIIMIVSAVAAVSVILVGLSMSFAARKKQHILAETTVVGWCVRIVKKIGRWTAEMIRPLPAVWKYLFAFGAYTLAGFGILLFIIASESVEFLLLVWVVKQVILFLLVCYLANVGHRFLTAAKRIAEGNLDYRMDEKGLFGNSRELAGTLNEISKGLTIAVEEQIKSERMKTELITNVSHDIKTPLTSIINYSDLIGREQTENETIREYAEVLHRQSVKLKRLMEDLVEVSKASTGNVEVTLAPCDAGVLINQIDGEFQDRLNASRLTLVTQIPEHPVMIMADQRRIWRVFENLMNNICKYALEGTRVYISLVEQDGKAVIELKNISRERLNVHTDELMERFVRGDSARSTEGNGLGLSIAQSLTQLQGGTLSIFVDGDLFKARVCFPINKA